MSVWAITMVKDEIDVIEPVLRHVAAQGVAGILIADNGSTDGTWQQVNRMHHQLDCDVVIVPDPSVPYYQSRKMTTLAQQAHSWGAEWIWPFDADEVWTATLPLAQAIDYTPADVIEVPLWHHYSTPADDSRVENPIIRMRYRGAEECELPKVIVRWRPGAVIEQGNHDARLPGEARRVKKDWQIRHFPYRSPEQFIKKAINGSRAYAGADIPDHIGAHWRFFGEEFARGGQDALRALYQKDFVKDPHELVLDPARLDA